MARGKQTITLPNGDEVNILFTNQALGDAQQAIGCSPMAILFEAQRQNIGQVEVANLLRFGMTAANRAAGVRKEAVSLSQAYKIMDEIGFIQSMEIVIKSMSEVLTYDGKSDDDTDPN